MARSKKSPKEPEVQDFLPLPSSSFHVLLVLAEDEKHGYAIMREVERISDGPKGDPNRRFALDWDPKHVWITSFAIKGETITLEGGAQAESDIAQVAKRMQASVYFDEISSPSSTRVDEKNLGIVYYKFTITGKVVY